MAKPQQGLAELPTRKEFNAFVDDGALISGVKRSTRDGFKKMIKDGAIRLFVPLHALDRLRRLSASNDRMARDARDALTWLDEVTSTSDRVYLQGGMELYENWQDVEQYLLPDTLLSMNSPSLVADSVADDMADLYVDGSDKASHSSRGSVEKLSKATSSPISTYSAGSPILANGSATPAPKMLAPIGTGRPGHGKSASVTSVASTESHTNGVSPGSGDDKRIPFSLRPFFNHILWRIHHEQNADVAAESFILVTNDALKQSIAQRFGLRAKRVEQLREIVAREDRQFKAQLASYEKANQPVDASDRPDLTIKEEDIKIAELSEEDDDVVVFKPSPPTAPLAMTATKVFDPDAFSRRHELRVPQSTTPVRPVSRQSNGSGFGSNSFKRGSPRARSGRPVSRGRGPSGGGFTPPMFVSPIAQKSMSPRQVQSDITRPIDPDSFSRPSPVVRGGRGGKRMLWEPS